MKRIAAVLVFAAATLMPAAKAAPADELFQQFGLFGNWAPDCGQAATSDNPHVSITAPSAGVVLEDHDLGAGYAINRYNMLSAERLSTELLAVETIFQPGKEGEERERLIFRVRERTRRTMFNQPEGGAIRVKDGVAVANGSRTPLLRKCD